MANNKKIIALGFRDNIGKDFMVKVLIEHFDYKKITIADELKDEIIKLKKMTYNEVYKYKDSKNKKYKSLTNRDLLIAYSKEIRRERGESYFIDLALSKVNYHSKYVFSDVRFKVELEGLKLFSNENNYEFISIAIDSNTVSKENLGNEYQTLDFNDFEYSIYNDRTSNFKDAILSLPYL